MELVAAVATDADESGVFEDAKVLRDRLSGGAQAVPGRQSRAELEQRLASPLGELVEDLAPGGFRESLEYVTHHEHNRQVDTCMSRTE